MTVPMNVTAERTQWATRISAEWQKSVDSIIETGRLLLASKADPKMQHGDVIARIAAQRLSERLGQTFVVENRPGAGTNLATEAVVRSAPDGYTLLVATSSNTINATLYEKSAP